MPLRKKVKKVGPGGTVGVQTELGPSVVKSDSLAGSIAGIPGKTPELLNEIKLKTDLLKRVVGTKEELEIGKITTGEPLLLNMWTSKSLGIVVSATDDKVHLKLKIPLAARKDEKVAILKKVANKWRLIGIGSIL